MNSELKYFHMEDRYKILIPILIMKGKSLKYISKRFGLTQRFLKHQFFQYYRKVSEVTLKSKEEPYYNDEMMYGKIYINYNWNELDNNEKLAWFNYNEKHKAYYD